MTSGVQKRTMMSSQMYAKMEYADVVRNTAYCLILRVSPGGIATMHTAVMTIRLNAAEPTIVDGPSSPELKPSLRTSTTERRISGADEPSAISVRLATVAFHTRAWNV